MTNAQLMTKEQHHWDIWIADDGVLGTSFAHGWLEPTDTLIVYDAPDTFDVQLRDSDGTILASGDDLACSTEGRRVGFLMGWEPGSAICLAISAPLSALDSG